MDSQFRRRYVMSSMAILAGRRSISMPAKIPIDPATGCHQFLMMSG
ncbi:hypothetical protein ACFQJD_01715 [Haloplanus sp. GCM10025708]